MNGDDRETISNQLGAYVRSLNLPNAVRHHEALRERLLAEFPELREDETALADTLDGVSNLDEAVTAVVRSLDDDEAMIAGIAVRVEELSERAGRYKHRVAKKREMIAAAMEAANLRKVVKPDFTLSLTPVKPKVIITDETAIPSPFLVWPEPPPPRPDKRLIAAALDCGTPVAGACLSNGGVGITLRRK